MEFSPLHLPGVHHCSSTWSDYSWQYSSQKRLTKVLSTLSWLPLCT